MRALNKGLAFGLLILLMMPVTACAKKEKCEITCKDGFTTTTNDSCDVVQTFNLAFQHGGCEAKEKDAGLAGLLD